jgi:protease IV
MVAVGAHKIVAQPTTVTGSIGVVAARVVVGPLLERLGVSVEVVKRGARADMHSPTRQLEDGERAVLERQLDHVYHSFVSAVALGRKREFAEVDALAGGRIWSGRDAHARGLVDRLGGFEAALTELRTLIGPDAGELEPSLVGPRRFAPATLGLPRFVALAAVAPLLPNSVRELVALCQDARDRSWLWTPFEEIDLGKA